MTLEKPKHVTQGRETRTYYVFLFNCKQSKAFKFFSFFYIRDHYKKLMGQGEEKERDRERETERHTHKETEIDKDITFFTITLKKGFCMETKQIFKD